VKRKRTAGGVGHEAAIRHLRGADPLLALLIDRVGPCNLSAAADGTHFVHLMRAIVYQQLSGKAAATIFGRVLDLFPAREPTPEAVKRMRVDRLRRAGLSAQKAAYVKDLALNVVRGHLRMEELASLPDHEVIESLVRVKGVGTWTAQMFLMFRLGRPNVLPVLDLGVRKGLQRTYSMSELPSPREVEIIGKVWEPYCSIAAWYLWRAVELE
jgi:DNA-3-methyladenine glycosylase II